MATREEKKQYLKSYKAYWHIWQMEHSRLMSYDLTHSAARGIQYSDMPHGSLNITDISDYMAEKEKLEESVRQKEQEYLMKWKEIHDAVHAMANPDHIRILDMRYLQSIKWEDMMTELRYERAQLARLINAALDAFEIPEGS